MKKSKTIIAPVEPDLLRPLFPYQISLASFVKNHHCARRSSKQLLSYKHDWFNTPNSIGKQIVDTRNVPG
jgi:hypothetical protein